MLTLYMFYSVSFKQWFPDFLEICQVYYLFLFIKSCFTYIYARIHPELHNVRDVHPMKMPLLIVILPFQVNVHGLETTVQQYYLITLQKSVPCGRDTLNLHLQGLSQSFLDIFEKISNFQEMIQRKMDGFMPFLLHPLPTSYVECKAMS